MKTLKCPNCRNIIDVTSTYKEVICPNCLANTGKSFIMVEETNSNKPRYLGGGLFEQPRKD